MQLLALDFCLVDRYGYLIASHGSLAATEDRLFTSKRLLHPICDSSIFLLDRQKFRKIAFSCRGRRYQCTRDIFEMGYFLSLILRRRYGSRLFAQDRHLLPVEHLVRFHQA